MLRKIPVILSALVMIGSSAMADTFAFERISLKNQWSYTDKVIQKGEKIFYDQTFGGKENVTIRDSSGEETNIYSALLGNSLVVKDFDFAPDFRVSAVRSIQLDASSLKKTCEVVIYSMASGVSVVDRWERNKLDNDYEFACTSGTAFLNDGSLIYLKIEDTGLFVATISKAGVKSQTLIKSLVGGEIFPYGSSDKFVENASLNSATLRYYDSTVFRQVAILYDLTTHVMGLKNYPSSLPGGSPSILKLLDNSHFAVSFGILNSTANIIQKFPREFRGVVWSDYFQTAIGEGTSNLLDDFSNGVLNGETLLPFSCMTSGLVRDEKIENVYQELPDGSLLVSTSRGLGKLKRISAELSNTRCIDISYSLSSECSENYRRSALNEFTLKKVPKEKFCTFKIMAKSPEGKGVSGLGGRVDVQFPFLFLTKFKTDSKGIAKIKLPMRALAKNKATVEIKIDSQKPSFQRRKVQILNYR